MNFEEMIFGERLAYLIKEELKRTKGQFAQELDYSHQYISKMCSSDRLPPDRVLNGICKKYNVNKQWLISGSGEPINQEMTDFEIAEIINELIRGDEPELREALKSFLKLSPSDKEFVRKLLAKLAK